MRALVLCFILGIASAPAFASKISERHKHLKMLHKEHKIVSKLMTKAEKDCVKSPDFRECYIKSITEQRTTHPRFSPETEQTLNNLTIVRRRKI
jgi:hypothetical protein